MRAGLFHEVLLYFIPRWSLLFKSALSRVETCRSALRSVVCGDLNTIFSRYFVLPIASFPREQKWGRLILLLPLLSSPFLSINAKVLFVCRFNSGSGCLLHHFLSGLLLPPHSLFKHSSTRNPIQPLRPSLRYGSGRLISCLRHNRWIKGLPSSRLNTLSSSFRLILYSVGSVLLRTPAYRTCALRESGTILSLFTLGRFIGLWSPFTKRRRMFIFISHGIRYSSSTTRYICELFCPYIYCEWWLLYIVPAPSHYRISPNALAGRVRSIEGPTGISPDY